MSYYSGSVAAVSAGPVSFKMPVPSSRFSSSGTYRSSGSSLERSYYGTSSSSYLSRSYTSEYRSKFSSPARTSSVPSYIRTSSLSEDSGRFTASSASRERSESRDSATPSSIGSASSSGVSSSLTSSVRQRDVGSSLGRRYSSTTSTVGIGLTAAELYNKYSPSAYLAASEDSRSAYGARGSRPDKLASKMASRASAASTGLPVDRTKEVTLRATPRNNNSSEAVTSASWSSGDRGGRDDNGNDMETGGRDEEEGASPSVAEIRRRFDGSVAAGPVCGTSGCGDSAACGSTGPQLTAGFAPDPTRLHHGGGGLAGAHRRRGINSLVHPRPSPSPAPARKVYDAPVPVPVASSDEEEEAGEREEEEEKEEEATRAKDAFSTSPSTSSSSSSEDDEDRGDEAGDMAQPPPRRRPTDGALAAASAAASAADHKSRLTYNSSRQQPATQAVAGPSYQRQRLASTGRADEGDSSILSTSPLVGRSSSRCSGNERGGLSGLRNIGNTCFMNSVIQCLSNTRFLLEYLLGDAYLSDINVSASSMKGALMKAFSTVIQELWREADGMVVNTTTLKSQIQRFAPRFMGYSQQDAQEFLRYLLEGLHEDVNRVTCKPKPILTEIDDSLSDQQKASESWKRYLRMDDSKIVDIFVGQLKSTLRCTVCGHCSVTFDPFWDLSLPIPSRTGQVRLQQCLDSFTSEEVLDGDEKPTCAKCKMRRKCTKSFTIQKFPKILVIHLKRFSPTERFRGKLSVTVDFPLSGLDLNAYAASRGQSCIYNLYAVSNHSGTTYSGHYTAYCRHPYTGEWHEYNDSRVSSISPRSVVSSEAYVLFYELSGHSSHL